MKKPNVTLRTTIAALSAVAMVGLAGQAVANSDILKNNKDQNLWGSPGGDYALTRHSGLKDINTKTVANLHMAWEQSTGALRGHEGQPVVVNHNGKPMMFFVSAWPNIVQALDLSDPDNPKQVWNYQRKTDRDMSAVPRACCDTVNRGLNYADGKVVFHTLDGLLIALDASTGKEVWVTKHAFPEHGETVTGPAMIVGGLVYVGFGGDEFAARGRIVAYDLKTGKEVWRAYSTGSDKDVKLTPNTNKANPQYGTYGHDLGKITYPNDEWKIGGGSPWAWYSYDPKLDMIYYGTGNPGLWSPAYRCGEKGKNLTQEKCNAYNPKINSGNWDNKWSMTIFARKAKTGEVVWAYQKTPFDQWDYDGVNENILVDLKVDGKQHKALVNFDRNGFAYVLDRKNGDLLRAHKYVTVNWATKVDLVTGRPLKVKEHSPFERGRNVSACPSAQGGKDQQPASVDPNDPEWFYVPTNNWCMEDEPQERTHTQQGTVYVFANVYMYQEKPGVSGKLKKFNVVTGKTAWEIPDSYQNWGGTLNTAGGLVFYGDMAGQFRAVDRNSGKVLWNKKLGSGIIGNPITWKVNGKQYVGVFSGLGGWSGLPVTADLDYSDKYGAIGATAMAKTAKLNLIPQGGLFTAFRVYP